MKSFFRHLILEIGQIGSEDDCFIFFQKSLKLNFSSSYVCPWWIVFWSNRTIKLIAFFIFMLTFQITKSQIYTATATESRWSKPTHDDGVGDNPNWKMKKLKREIKHESCLTCVIRDVLPQVCHTKHGNFVSKKNKIQTLCDKFKHWKFSISIHIQ